MIKFRKCRKLSNKNLSLEESGKENYGKEERKKKQQKNKTYIHVYTNESRFSSPDEFLAHKQINQGQTMLLADDLDLFLIDCVPDSIPNRQV